MTTLTQGFEIGEFLMSEGNGKISREVQTVTIASAAKYPSGTVMGKITATGKFKHYDDAASDGSQTATGVLMTPLMDGVNGDKSAVVIVRSAEVISDRLTGIDANGTADLKALGIIVR